MNVPVLVSETFTDDFYPFSLTRSVADLRCGILTIRQKWNLLLQNNLSFPAEVSIPANIIPDQELVQAICTGKFLQALEKANKLLNLTDILRLNDSEIKKDFQLITGGRFSSEISSSNKVSGSAIFLEPGAIVEHCFLNASNGPVYIGKDSLIMEGSMIRGPFAMGEKSLVKMGAKIYGSTTAGAHCVLGGEIKNSIISDYSNKAHDGYLGDSLIGQWCNLGAGCTNSNVKNSGGSVKLWNPIKKEYMDAGQKFGLIMGDYCRAAINTSFNTGTVVGPASHVFGNRATPTYLPSFSWGLDGEVYEFDKALLHIEKWKQLKGQYLTNDEKQQLKYIFDQQNQRK